MSERGEVTMDTVDLLYASHALSLNGQPVIIVEYATFVTFLMTHINDHDQVEVRRLLSVLRRMSTQRSIVSFAGDLVTYDTDDGAVRLAV
jgi:hypothetical protein